MNALGCTVDLPDTQPFPLGCRRYFSITPVSTSTSMFLRTWTPLVTLRMCATLRHGAGCAPVTGDQHTRMSVYREGNTAYSQDIPGARSVPAGCQGACGPFSAHPVRARNA